MTEGRIVVTGAASGIGAALVQNLAASGCKVIPLDRKPVAIDPFVACDLTDPASIDAAAAAINGAIDGIACVAGVPGTLDAATVLKVNYLGTRRLVEVLLPRLRDSGSVVLVASLAARRCGWTTDRLREVLSITSWDDALQAIGPVTGNEAYEISKRLLLAYIPMATAAHTARRLRFNAVSPGPVETPILGDFTASMGHDRIDAARNLVGRHARAEEVAAPIQFLLASSASWVNGIELTVDGGLSAAREASAQ
jgi:NAD(P)-dependent dehydrogenase (short-subunit alcohol dehydrogenase family)